MPSESPYMILYMMREREREREREKERERERVMFAIFVTICDIRNRDERDHHLTFRIGQSQT